MNKSNVRSNILNYKSGDILDANDQYIAQQCNCTTSNYKGLSLYILKKFPWADFYKTSYRVPGTIVVKGDEKLNQRYVIGMFAQKQPGPPKYSNDTDELRIEWFQICLNEIAKIPNIKEIGFPFKIGCGLAGGEWKIYRRMLEEFAQKNTHIIVNIYQLE